MYIGNERTAVENDFVSYIPALQSFAWRFHTSQTDVDDLVQETITKALANLDKYRPGTQLKSWLFTIMRNTFCTKFGLSKREQLGVVDDSASRSGVPPFPRMGRSRSRARASGFASSSAVPNSIQPNFY
ncbi:sigma factor [Rhizobium sp. RM]|uniref:sigma factor n=1 Tax=Rhizobium sp. RM TaxID=2748079 RepID=UPI001FEF2402|nr:sigma factor [Rhizobium sp. RM]